MGPVLLPQYQNSAKTVPERKLQTNTSCELRCKNPKENAGKPDPAMNKKSHVPQ